ncbi:MAG: SIS domain-containing protein [bacterium]|nr:SIS domain-containing protein [bacterium]
MKFSEHVEKIGEAVQKTFEYDHDFAPIDSSVNKIYIVGSGSSYSQALYLGRMLNEVTPFKAIPYNPYSFVKYSSISDQDILIHISQEAKRNDNKCPVAFAKSKGTRVILFSSKTGVLECDEEYYFSPESEKALVASESYMSGYALILKYVSFQITALGLHALEYDVEQIVSKIKTALNQKWLLDDTKFTSFLYTGYAESVAIEGALKYNECLLRNAEAYEMKLYSHGKHFVSHIQPMLFNVFVTEKDNSLLDMYNSSVFEDHHAVNIFKSTLPDYLCVFEHSAMMLGFIVQSMQNSNIELENIEITESMRLPHTLQY